MAGVRGGYTSSCCDEQCHVEVQCDMQVCRVVHCARLGDLIFNFNHFKIIFKLSKGLILIVFHA